MQGECPGDTPLREAQCPDAAGNEDRGSSDADEEERHGRTIRPMSGNRYTGASLPHALVPRWDILRAANSGRGRRPAAESRHLMVNIPPVLLPPVIRPARLDDAERITALVNGAYRGDGSRAGWTTEADLLDGTRVTEPIVAALLADPRTTILLCEDAGRLLGCVELRREAARLYLGMLTVAPGEQGRGLGSLLMDAAEAQARDLGLQAIVMTVISVRDALIAWYRRRGFRPTGATHAFAFTDPGFGQPKRPLEFAVLEKRLD